eukprot:Hpha_TRINITY_DN18570_c0_g1::TRINITY_DN18570_c0_g1_i1::g.195204::m.195204
MALSLFVNITNVPGFHDKTVPLEVDPMATVGDVLKELESVTGQVAMLNGLYYQGEQFKDADKALADLGVCMESTMNYDGISKCEFEVGMRVEALDRAYPHLRCVAFIKNAVRVRDKQQITISFDGWTRRYDYTCDANDPDVVPVGTCEVLNIDMQKPNKDADFKGWDEYLQRIDAKAAPLSCFPDLVSGKVLPFEGKMTNRRGFSWRPYTGGEKLKVDTEAFWGMAKTGRRPRAAGQQSQNQSDGGGRKCTIL